MAHLNGDGCMYEFGRFRVNCAERQLLRGGQPVALASKVFDTLLVLIQHSGHVLKKDELMREVWPDGFVEEVNLAHNISVLRKALSAGEGDGAQTYIETVPKLGYRFVALVTRLGSSVDAPAGFVPPFGKWLKEQRTRLDLTQGDLARRVGYSPETIRKIEAGVLKPSKQIVDLLADHLGVPSSRRDAFIAFATDARTDKSQPAHGNLPNPLTSLFGREKDVAAVRKLLRTADARLVTLLGPPGVGKTRLAIQVAREVVTSFADGVWFVGIASITEPEAVLSSIVQALGVEQLPGLTAMQTLQRHLRERRLLLVLDNLEQVLAAAPLIADVLASAPGVKVLSTSREPLITLGFCIKQLPRT